MSELQGLQILSLEERFSGVLCCAVRSAVHAIFRGSRLLLSPICLFADGLSASEPTRRNSPLYLVVARARES